MEKIRIAVYGSLRRGGWFNRILGMNKMDHTLEIIKGIRIYDMGDYPGAIITKDPKDEAVVEIYEFDQLNSKRVIERYFGRKKGVSILDVFDRIEGVDKGFYKRDIIQTLEGEAFIYTLKHPAILKNVKEFPVVRDWISGR